MRKDIHTKRMRMRRKGNEMQVFLRLCALLAVVKLAVVKLAVVRRAVVRLAVVKLAVVRLAMVRRAVSVLPVAGLLLLSGCFEEDVRVEPHVPGDESSFRFEASMYDHQFHFDLGRNEIAGTNKNGDWLIRFGAQPGDRRIGINSAALWSVYNTGTDDPGLIPEPLDPEAWVYDASSGNADSTAFRDWIRIEGNDTIYTLNLYLIGAYDGLNYQPRYLCQFLHCDAAGYRFRIRPFPQGDWKEYAIPKDPGMNYQYFHPGKDDPLVAIEPGAGSWDLLFSQYGTTLYTSEGVPTPYYVRGVLLNRSGVAAALDTLHSFAEISFDEVAGYTFSERQDFIGHDWKDVEVDVQSNTAVYTVRPRHTYIIRDTEGFYYKLRFVSFYSLTGEKGYPVIEHQQL